MNYEKLSTKKKKQTKKSATLQAVGKIIVEKFESNWKTFGVDFKLVTLTDITLQCFPLHLML